MAVNSGKLILTAVAAVLAAGGLLAASRMHLLPAKPGGAQHGLASQPESDSGAADADAPSLADLTARASSGEPSGDAPFSIMPAQSSPAAPDFTLTTLDGKSVKLSEAVKSGPVLLDFWATWCGPCRMEMPELGAVYGNYKTRGVQIYGVNSDDSVANQKKFFSAASPGYPMLTDTSGVVHTSYNISAIPALFLIDQSGRVRSATVGFDSDTQTDLPRSLDQLLAEHPQKTL